MSIPSTYSGINCTSFLKGAYVSQMLRGGNFKPSICSRFLLHEHTHLNINRAAANNSINTPRSGGSGLILFYRAGFSKFQINLINHIISSPSSTLVSRRGFHSRISLTINTQESDDKKRMRSYSVSGMPKY